MKRPVRVSRRSSKKRQGKAHKKFDGPMNKTIQGDFFLPISYKLTLERKRGKDTGISLNLNWYRNATFYQQNEVKQEFTKSMEEHLTPVLFEGKIHITYTLFTGDNRTCDVANVCSIVDKFFSDALTYYGCITDDDYRYLPGVSYQFGGVDKGAARVEIYVSEYTDTWSSKLRRLIFGDKSNELL